MEVDWGYPNQFRLGESSIGSNQFGQLVETTLVGREGKSTLSVDLGERWLAPLAYLPLPTRMSVQHQCLTLLVYQIGILA